MALSNFPVDHTAPKPVGGDGVTVKIPRSVIYVVVAILVLTAVYVLGTTFKERVTDPAIDKTVETVDSVAEDIAAMPRKQLEETAISAVKAEVAASLVDGSPPMDERSYRICSREEAISAGKTFGIDDLMASAPDYAIFVLESTRGIDRPWYVLPDPAGFEVE